MLFIGSDHAGFVLKEKLKGWLGELGVDFQDVGPNEFNPTDDYPLFAKPVAEKVSQGEGEGILICDTGEGMAIAANKFPGVRATLVTSDLTAARSREHNNSNVLVLGSELQSEEDAKRFLEVWLTTPYSNEERHERRLREIKDLEGG
jgi:ribose 5-phosphate isomerase B